ncbi:hypothetical protein D3C81_727310 [compost metagenome]
MGAYMPFWGNEGEFSLFEGLESHFVSWNPALKHLFPDVAGQEALLQGVEFQSNHAILDVFDKLSANFFEVTPKWAQLLQKYVYNFITRRVGLVDHMEFFGSPYLGLQKITFTTADRNEWFANIFDCDEEELRENLHACQAIKKEWAVVGDAFNMTVPYLLYRVGKSKLPEGMKHQAMKDVLCMYHYKCLTSIIHNDYPFTARKEVVIETYNRLSLKYDIKRYGSWKALIEARAEWILDPKTGIHYEAFTKMDDDKKIVYMVGDIQNRLRRAINDINKVFHDVKNKTNIVKLEGSKVNLGDELTVKSVSKEINQYMTYLDQILTEETSFFKEELMNLSAGVLEDVRMDMLAYTLQEFPKRYNNPKMPEYKEFAETVVLHMFEYLHANGIKKSKVYNVLIKMRGAYGASRSKNDMVKVIRELGDQIVMDITGRKTPQWVLTTRTALSLFICLRVLSKDFFE